MRGHYLVHPVFDWALRLRRGRLHRARLDEQEVPIPEFHYLLKSQLQRSLRIRRHHALDPSLQLGVVKPKHEIPIMLARVQSLAFPSRVDLQEHRIRALSHH